MQRIKKEKKIRKKKKKKDLSYVQGARRRSRSREPLDYFKFNLEIKHQTFNLFSFQIDYQELKHIDRKAGSARRRILKLTNFPVQLGMSNIQICKVISDKIDRDQAVANVTVNENQRTVLLEMASSHDCVNLCNLQKIQLIEGMLIKVHRLGEYLYGQSQSSNKQQIQNAAFANAAALTAINKIQKKNTKYQYNIQQKKTDKSRFIKLQNAITEQMYNKLSQKELKQIIDDLRQELQSHGKIVDFNIIKRQGVYGTSIGTIIIEYQKNPAQTIWQNNGRLFEGRQIQLSYIGDQVIQKYYNKFIK